MITERARARSGYDPALVGITATLTTLWIVLRASTVLQNTSEHTQPGASLDEKLLRPVRARCVLRGAVTLWVFPTVRSPLERITEEHRA